MKQSKCTYNLYSTERELKNETLISYYFQRNKKIIKNFSPVDINGERFRLNLESGEITEYKKQDIMNSFQVSLKRTKICMNLLLAVNDFDWFWTLTFDKAKIDRTDDKQVFDCYKKYIDNLKHQFPSFKYMTFPERHKDGCFHFHLLVAGLTPKQMGLVNSGKVCCHWAKKKYNGICSREYFEQTKNQHTLKDTDGETIYNATSFIYGYTTVSRIVSRERCNSYVKKYVEKALGSTDVFKKRFYYSSNLNVPTSVKKLIAADFDTIKTIDCIPSVINSPYVKCAKAKPNVNDYNVLQIKIDNNAKTLIDSGIIPLSNYEYADIFNNENEQQNLNL